MCQRTFLMLGINCVPGGQLMGRWESVVSTGEREEMWGEKSPDLQFNNILE